MKQVEIIELAKIYDPRGSLSVAEENIHIPFQMGRIEWITLDSHPKEGTPINLPKDSKMLVALSGQVTIQITEKDGLESKDINLSQPNLAVVMAENCKSSITDYAENSLLLIIHKKRKK